MKTIERQMRQGDVLLTKVSARFKKSDLVGASTKALTVALGEATGHRHTFSGSECALYVDEGSRLTGESPAAIIARLGGGRVKVSDATLRHQEHAPAKFDGDFKITIQREYVRGAIRNVAD